MAELLVYPSAIKIDLPVKNSVIDFLPIVLIEGANNVTVSEEALMWARYMSHGYSVTGIDVRISALTRFINFYNLWTSDLHEIGPEEQTNTILIFTHFRINGTISLDKYHVLKALNWRPVKKETARQDFNYILEFFFFSEQNLDGVLRTISKEALHFPTDYKKKMEVLKHSTQSEFLSHISNSARYWEDLRDAYQYRVPRWARPSNSKSLLRPFPTLEEIKEIISAEKNPAFKALWIAGAFGSHRISEQLNCWQCDILPPSSREFLFGNNSTDSIVYLMAHPSESTYIGDLTKSLGPTREQYLKDKYRLIPRNHYPKTDNRRAGWKAKSLFGKFSTADTFWLNSSAAKLFEACTEEIHSFHLKNKTSKNHPYFFVNMLSRDENFSNPIQLKRVERAWVNACKRAGITPYRNGRNIHGLRHFAKHYASNVLGLNAREIQLIRGDTSIDSQNDYGRDIVSLNSTLKTFHTKGANLDEIL
ncbi:MAG: hypothetical protein JJ879_13075 [Sneathiella sp.]|nr:hypothetical protein [Sneathiella sp.]